MAYTTYTTLALVCGTYDRNTTDRSYRLFTRELGMVWADARSVRLEKSRQRMALQDFSHIKVSLVKGKGGWKIGSVSELANYYAHAADQSARGSVVSLVRLLRRFVAGEEPQSELFDLCLEALTLLAADLHERDCMELVCTQRVLSLLGYIQSTDIPTDLRHLPIRDVEPALACQHKRALERSINRAQTASHL